MQQITNVDQFKRSLRDWAKIYHITILNKDIDLNREVNEYEWAWLYFYKLKYLQHPDNVGGDYTEFEQYQIRAEQLNTDIMLNATSSEKYHLKDKYIDTNFIRKQLHLL